MTQDAKVVESLHCSECAPEFNCWHPTSSASCRKGRRGETLTREQVERIDALAAKATPDNWHERGRAGYIVKGPSFGPAKGMVAEFDCGNYANSKEEGQANAGLTCTLVNAWPQLRKAALLSLEYSERITKLEGALKNLADQFVDMHARVFPSFSVTKNKWYADARAALEPPRSALPEEPK
jgi:hypothetical protein